MMRIMLKLKLSVERSARNTSATALEDVSTLWQPVLEDSSGEKEDDWEDEDKVLLLTQTGNFS